MPENKDEVEEDQSVSHEVPEDLVELHEAIEADKAGMFGDKTDN